MLLLIPTTILHVRTKHFPQQESFINRPEEGIYLKGEDFLRQCPLTKKKILTDADTSDLEFYGKMMNQKEIRFVLNGKEQKVLTDSIWGFAQNNTLYVNVQGRFYRVPVWGSICYFTAVVEVNTGLGWGAFDPVTGMSMQAPTRTRELREFLILLEENSKPVLFDRKKLENHFKKDSSVWKAYTSESPKKRQKHITKYIRLYNVSNPLHKKE